MNVKLTKRKAWELISRIQPRLNIKQEATPSDVAIFKASTGPEGLEIRCENDWFNHNGRIKLTIGNVDGGTPIIRYYYPDTLNRDYVAEQAEKEAEAKQARKEWVWAMSFARSLMLRALFLAAPFITCLEEQVWTGLKPSVWKKLMVVWRSSRLLKLVESCS